VNRYTADDIERAVREAAEHGARAALARFAPAPSPPPPPALPAWCSVAEYADHIGNPFVSIGYAMPFFFAATHWYIYGLNPWMAAHAVLLPLFFFLAISNGITRHKNELRWRGYKSTDALTDTFERYVDATYPEFGQRQQTPPAVPGVVTYRG